MSFLLFFLKTHSQQALEIAFGCALVLISLFGRGGDDMTAFDLVVQGGADIVKGLGSVTAGELAIAVVVVAAVIVVWNWAKNAVPTK